MWGFLFGSIPMARNCESHHCTDPNDDEVEYCGENDGNQFLVSDRKPLKTHQIEKSACYGAPGRNYGKRVIHPGFEEVFFGKD